MISGLLLSVVRGVGVGNSWERETSRLSGSEPYTAYRAPMQASTGCPSDVNSRVTLPVEVVTKSLRASGLP